jgi:hypothetical protein
MGVGGLRHALTALPPTPTPTPGNDPVSIVLEARWTPELVWRVAENLAPPRFDPRTV